MYKYRDQKSKENKNLSGQDGRILQGLILNKTGKFFLEHVVYFILEHTENPEK